jgi:hypothetical protein
MIPKVTSLNDLYNRSISGALAQSYAKLIQLASENLGGPGAPIKACFGWLVTNAYETSEEEVVDEVNFMIEDLLP